MNNYFSTLLLIIFCNLHAVRYEFENGTILDVPDTIVIHNDLEIDVIVYEAGCGVELGHHLRKTKTLKLEDMYCNHAVTIHHKDSVFPLLFHSGGSLSDNILKKGLFSIFEYNLSDIVNHNKNVQGHTIIKRVREYMEEVTTLAIGNKN